MDSENGREAHIGGVLAFDRFLSGLPASVQGEMPWLLDH